MAAQTMAESEGLRREYVQMFAGSSDPLHRAVISLCSPDRPFVVADPDGGGNLDFDEMVEYLDSRRVSKTYWPERLELVDSLPRTPSGKIQKYVLRAQARELVTT